jgi:hypothetical protein
MSDSTIISSTEIPENLQAPKPSNNELGDIIKWLKLGDVVVLMGSKYVYYIYHDCKKVTDIDTVRTIYINCEKKMELLSKDEWPWFIENENFGKCSCIKNRSKYSYECRI